MAKGGATLNMREARTKPTSPDRSLLLLHNSYNQPSKKVPIANSTNIYLAANQREERKALNMVSTLGKNDLLGGHHHHGGMPVNISSLSQNQRVAANVELTKQANSIASTINGSYNGGATSGNTKRKNFKNMFYSPKNNNRETAFTEPQSKIASQIQTKEHSPVQRLGVIGSHQQHQILIQSNGGSSNAIGNSSGYHSKMKTTKPPTQLKN